jgi:putative phage-type endonuclease
MNEEIEVIIPKSDEEWHAERAKDITSTEVSALFGASPYTTLFETWHRHRGDLATKFEPTERTLWGTRLEKTIAQGIAEDKGWKIRPMKEYMRDKKRKIGASFDFNIYDPEAILEIKNVDSLVFRNEWDDQDGQLEAPEHIEIQIQHQLAVSGLNRAFIGALIGGNTIKIIERERDEKFISEIYNRVEKFWDSIETRKEPSPDFSKDFQTMKALYNKSTPGKIVDATDVRGLKTLAMNYKELSAERKKIEDQIEVIKAEILFHVGDAEKIIGENFSIGLGIVKGGPVSYVREDYRSFRPYFKKDKKR